MATGSVGNVFIMFASDPTARFVSVDIYGDDSVASLIKRFSVQCFLDAGHLDLFLIKVDGEDEPSEAEVSALRSPRLQVGWPLSRASIASGAWLLGRSTLAGGGKSSSGAAGDGTGGLLRVSLTRVAQAAIDAICAGLKRRFEDIASSFHAAAPLVHTAGSAWVYQPSPVNAEKICFGLRNLAVAWTAASVDKSMRPVFTIASGPGTGKSRLLDELPALCRAAAADNTTLAALLARAYVFKVSFENGTPFDSDVEADLSGDVAIGTRMMRQLTDATDLTFPAFRSRNSCTIDDALLALARITGTPRDKQVVFLLVDGMQRLLPMPQDRAATPPDPVKFRSAINAVSACVNGFPECVVGAIAATVTLPIERVFGSAVAEGSQQTRIYLLPPPLSRPEDVVRDIPDMPLLRILRDDMGGHGRALEILAQHLYIPFVGLRSFSSVAADTLTEISTRYRSWTATEGIQELHEPLLRAVVARRRLRLTDTIPGCPSSYWTVDKVCSLGLVRLATTEPGQSGHLEMAVVLLQVIRRELRISPLTTLVPDYAFLESSDRVAKTWQDFEDFVANIRAIKVAAFQDMASVPLSELHAGAQLSAAATATEVRVPRGPGVVRVIHSTAQHDTTTFPLDAHSSSVAEGSLALHDVVLNGVSASAGDIFLRLDRLESSSGLFVPALEVLACRHRRENVNAAAFDCELDKALGDRRSTSFFLFVTSARVYIDIGALASSAALIAHSDSSDGGGAASGRQTRSVAGGQPRVFPAQRRAGELVGYIDATCFESYFGSFAGRVFHLLHSIPPAV